MRRCTELHKTGRDLLLLWAALQLPACQRGGVPGPVAPAMVEHARSGPALPSAGPVIRFQATELPFVYERGASGNCWPVEPIGGGVALLDFNGDGRLDVFLPQGQQLPLGSGPHPPAADVLLRNNGDRTFTDVSASAGLVPKGYGVGVTVADFDADGDGDVYVTRYGPNTLWRNEGGRFVDVTAQTGTGCPAWSLGAAFADFDNDGDLDLFVANYLDFDPADAPFARDAAGAPEYGLPDQFLGLADVLYRNDGGTFIDVTAPAGVGVKTRGMGVLAADFDRDGRIDFLVANDGESNVLWRNRGSGAFEDVAYFWGVALNADGKAEANMGIAHGDTDGDGQADLLISHFVFEHDTLWRAKATAAARATFVDETHRAGLAMASKPYTGWGTVFADFDQDGDLDLVVVNGHIRRWPGLPFPYENPPLLGRNDGMGRFADVSATAGDYFQGRYQARGLAAGDLDGDGDVDLVVVHHHRPSVVLWNDSAPQGNFLIVDLCGAGKNRDAIGARLTAHAGGRVLVRTVDGGGSYLSSSDRRIHLGLGAAERLERSAVIWPDGSESVYADVAANQVVRWTQKKNRAGPQ